MTLITRSIYPERDQRRALYHTGLPPRDGGVLVQQLSEIKGILQEAVDFVMWGTQERIRHFARLIETTSSIEAFGIRDLNIGRSRIAWSDVLAWWMAPDSSNRSPTPNSVSRWYDFASRHFIYGLNWAIGSIIGSVLERDGGDGQLLDRWQRCELPWSVMWYKDMISWGTFDPIASYALTKKEAFTRPVASEIAAEFWESIAEISDAALEPKSVAEWMNERGQAKFASEEDLPMPQSEIPVELIEDFSEYEGPQLRVWPAVSDHLINWFDPGGYLIARSDMPENWERLKVSESDFMLDPSSEIVAWQYYI